MEDFIYVILSCSDLIQGQDFPFDGVEDIRILTKNELKNLQTDFHNMENLDVRVEKTTPFTDPEALSKRITHYMEVSQDKSWDADSDYVKNMLKQKNEANMAGYTKGLHKSVINPEIQEEGSNQTKKMIENIQKFKKLEYVRGFLKFMV